MKSSLVRYSGSGLNQQSEGKLREREGFVVFKPWKDSETEQIEDNKLGFRLYNCEAALIRKTLEANGLKETDDRGQWTILWGAGLLRSSLYLRLSRGQKINHFPRSVEITRKDSLFKNLSKMQALHTARQYGFFPATYLLPAESQVLSARIAKHPEEVWILKPPGGSQGKGISLVRSIAEVPAGHNYVASLYVDNPLLVTGRKCDLRIYVAMTSVNPLRLYIYQEGLARFAVLPYDSTDLENRYVHLTNYSLNKMHPLYTSSACKWTLSAFKSHLFTHHNIDFSPIWAQIKAIVIKTVISIESTVNSAMEMYVPHRNNCFELLGFDVMLDERLNVWLLEVNLSPSLRCDEEVDVEVKSRLIADLFTLIGVKKAADNREMSLSPSKRSARGPITTSRDVSIEGQMVLRDTLEEANRMGNFERIFPSKDSQDYLEFFDEPRPLNSLLIDRFVRKKQAAVPQRLIKLRPIGLPQRIPRLKREFKVGSGAMGSQEIGYRP